MDPPRRAPPPLHDPLRRPPRHPIRRASSAQRARLLPLPPTRVRHTPPVRRRAVVAPYIAHPAPRTEFPWRRHGRSSSRSSHGRRRARDNASGRAEHVSRAYDARDHARDPRGRLSRLSARAGQVRDLWCLSHGHGCRRVCVFSGYRVRHPARQSPGAREGAPCVGDRVGRREMRAGSGARSGPRGAGQRNTLPSTACIGTFF